MKKQIKTFYQLTTRKQIESLDKGVGASFTISLISIAISILAFILVLCR